MKGKDWILLDTETTGLFAPVFLVELVAQRMCGWQPEGEPFRKLLNQNEDIPAEASRVHGYTREILSAMAGRRSKSIGSLWNTQAAGRSLLR